MSDDFTPQMEQVRAVWCAFSEYGGLVDREHSGLWDDRLAEFDRWLASVKAEAKAEALEEARAEFDEFSMNANEQVMPGTSGWRFVTVGEWLDNRAAAIRAAAENGESND